MRRLLLVAALALATAGGAAADTFIVVPSAPAASAFSAVPNAPDSLGLPLELSSVPSQSVQLSVEQLTPLWQRAGEQYGIPWTVLAAINKVESNFGQNMGPSSAGAIGWMQFMPDTWLRWGVDANGDGVADPWNAEDAIASAARYLAAAGGATDIARAVFAYNHAQWYVDEVLQLANAYAGGGADFAASLQRLQQQLDDAQSAVVTANQALADAQSTARRLSRREHALLARASGARLLSYRLEAQKAAVLLDGDLQQAQADLEQRRTDLADAEAALQQARDASRQASFAPGAGGVLAAPTFSDGYVFPVGGGPGVVSVGLTHHDYPAADIAAPEGSPVYALSDAIVQEAWPEPSGNCGIGVTMQTTDGLTWTYCHLAYLDPSVAVGAQLAAGAPVGLIGQTGHADGPHLHLQLQPATGYPQDEAWFQSFAGTAFSWSVSVQSNAASTPLFAVVPDGGQAPAPAPSRVVLFTA